MVLCKRILTKVIVFGLVIVCTFTATGQANELNEEVKMRQDNEGRAEYRSGVVFVNEGVALEEPVLVCILLYHCKRVTEGKRKEKKKET